MFYENMQSFRVSAGAYVGDSVNITPSYPQTPWMEFRYSCTTGENGTGDKLFLYTSDLAPVAEVRGTFGLDRTAKRLDCSNKFPEYTCAYYFKEYLNQNGIACDSIGDFRLDKEWIRRGEIKELGKTYSPQLRRIIFETNHISNNVFAETLLRSLGREMTGDACYESSCIAIANILTGLGIDTSRGARIKDGSGLSRQNYISSDFFCRFLLGMMESPHFEHFVNSLPSPGSDGSMIYNMRKYSDSIKSRIKVKSGSMNGVRCYSGYVIPTDGGKEDVIIFSLMINNCTSSSGQMRNLMDSIMAELAKEN
jgi:D-alanyl-D-alanine carboxypeptidase/D-alanyl-D-alanine-endopeptidase (penicillin-binding protein 4)